jgi:hypothetical protein
MPLTEKAAIALMTATPNASVRVILAETDCVAGHVGLEPANPWASYSAEIPWRLCLK